jgi:hypothetical protein
MERIYLEDDEEVLCDKSNAERQRPQLNLCVGLVELGQIRLVKTLAKQFLSLSNLPLSVCFSRSMDSNQCDNASLLPHVGYPLSSKRGSLACCHSLMIFHGCPPNLTILACDHLFALLFFPSFSLCMNLHD